MSTNTTDEHPIAGFLGGLSTIVAFPALCLFIVSLFTNDSYMFGWSALVLGVSGLTYWKCIGILGER